MTLAHSGFAYAKEFLRKFLAIWARGLANIG